MSTIHLGDILVHLVVSNLANSSNRGRDKDKDSKGSKDRLVNRDKVVLPRWRRLGDLHLGWSIEEAWEVLVDRCCLRMG